MSGREKREDTYKTAPAVNLQWKTLEEAIRAGVSDADLGRAVRILTLQHKAELPLITETNEQFDDDDSVAVRMVYDKLAQDASNSAESYRIHILNSLWGNVKRNAGVDQRDQLLMPRTTDRQQWLGIYIRIHYYLSEEAWDKAVQYYGEINKRRYRLPEQAEIMNDWLDETMQELGITDQEALRPSVDDYCDSMAGAKPKPKQKPRRR